MYQIHLKNKSFAFVFQLLFIGNIKNSDHSLNVFSIKFLGCRIIVNIFKTLYM